MEKLRNVCLCLVILGIILPCAESVPAIDPGTLTASLAENSAAGTIVTTLVLTDFTQTAVDAVIAFGAHTPAVTGSPWFELVDKDVKVISGATVNYEDAALIAASSVYEIVVTAIHAGDGESATATIVITITDIAATLNTGLTASLDENSASGTIVTNVGPTAAGVAFHMGTIAPNHDYFEIATLNAGNGKMTVKAGATIDYEAVDLTSKEYEIQVIAIAQDGERTTATATITIVDVPEFDTTTLNKNQSESLAVGGSVTTVTTTTASSTFTLVAQDPDQGKFTVTTAGVVNLAATLDYDDSALATANYEYKLTIRATHPSNSNTGTATLTITILEYPVFSNSLSANLEENSVAGTDVFTIVTDPVGAVLETVTQTGNLGWLSLSPSTRKVTVAADITVDYEEASLTDHKYMIEIKASDSGKTATVTLTANIQDVDENGAAENGVSDLIGNVIVTILLSMTSMII